MPGCVPRDLVYSTSIRIVLEWWGLLRVDISPLWPVFGLSRVQGLWCRSTVTEILPDLGTNDLILSITRGHRFQRNRLSNTLEIR